MLKTCSKLICTIFRTGSINTPPSWNWSTIANLVETVEQFFSEQNFYQIFRWRGGREGWVLLKWNTQHNLTETTGVYFFSSVLLYFPPFLPGERSYGFVSLGVEKKKSQKLKIIQLSRISNIWKREAELLFICVNSNNPRNLWLFFFLTRGKKIR